MSATEHDGAKKASGWNEALEEAAKLLESTGLPDGFQVPARVPAVYEGCTRDELVAFLHADMLTGLIRGMKR